MPILTIVVGVVLTGFGLHLYFGSATPDPSVTALIPAFVGVPLILCGLIAQREKWRMHAMHVAVLVGLAGAVAALGRMAMKISTLIPALISDDPTIHRPARSTFLMALICIVYVGLCVRSFIQSRRRRMQREAD
ncbi:MAG: hypothetical protein HY288_05215 [Planctomycetia bacterium]|nr:hypothetical protein [Planctomycetia bacterium]